MVTAAMESPFAKIWLKWGSGIIGFLGFLLAIISLFTIYSVALPGPLSIAILPDWLYQFFLWWKKLVISSLSFRMLSDREMFTLGKWLLILAFLPFLLNPRLRRAWLEIGFLALLVFTVVIITTTPPSLPMPPNLSLSTNTTFNLPVSKLQSDLNGLQPGSQVLIVLAGNQEKQQSYTATLVDVMGEGSDALAPPYKNKDAVTIHISLAASNAVEFADQLANASTIFLLLLPSTPAPSPPSGGGTH